MKPSLAGAASLLLLLAIGTADTARAEGRDRIMVTGSATVFPFTVAVAERFGQRPSAQTPLVEATGTVGGLKLFCEGVGTDTPDVADASRRITASELDTCRKNGVTPIEIKIGYDGIAFANSTKSQPLDVTTEQLYLALADQVPAGPNHELVKNPYRLWSDIAPGLPNRRIEIIGPPTTSGTRDVILETVMHAGCDQVSKRLGVQIDVKICETLRTDGGYIESPENYDLVVQKLQANPNAFGLFGFSFLVGNADKVQPSKINGISNTTENIISGAYPMSRPLFIYVKKEHIGVVPGLQEFVNEYTADTTWGEGGYLEKRGLVPLPRSERDRVGAQARALTALSSVD